MATMKASGTFTLDTDPPNVKWALKIVGKLTGSRNYVSSIPKDAFGCGPYQTYFYYGDDVLEGWSDSCPNGDYEVSLCIRGYHVFRLMTALQQGEFNYQDLLQWHHDVWLVQVAGPAKSNNTKSVHRYIRFHTKLTKQDIEELNECTTRSQVRRVLGFGADEGVVW